MAASVFEGPPAPRLGSYSVLHCTALAGWDWQAAPWWPHAPVYSGHPLLNLPHLHHHHHFIFPLHWMSPKITLSKFGTILNVLTYKETRRSNILLFFRYVFLFLSSALKLNGKVRKSFCETAFIWEEVVSKFKFVYLTLHKRIKVFTRIQIFLDVLKQVYPNS